ncbi:zinc finger protein 583-like [Thalassophryne amazonica]|uniref:zinc finger protein 583-like n=1 Tax=Thalassophryne amazonica TaxID=390379 RepID=UPI0014723824|nr:zinc finger protein 583-like [Thalassophryne amazonica]
MSKVQLLRGMLKLRLTAAVKEILDLFERMTADYEEEIHRLKEENKGGEVLDAGFNSRVRLYIADMQQLLESKEDFLPEQQEWNQTVDQKNSEPPNIKEEQEELWNEEKLESPQSHQSHESTEGEHLSNNSTEHRTFKTEADGDDCGGSQPARDSGPCTHLHLHPDDVQQLLIKDEILPEDQQWSLSVDQERIKEEQEKLWVSQQGQQLHQLEEADITKFPFTAVHVKSENDYEKVESSQFESTDAEPVASSSGVYRTRRAKTEGEGYGGPQQSSSLGPSSHLQRDTSGRSSDSSETEIDDSYDWKQTREQVNRNVSVHHGTFNIAKKQHNCCEYGKLYGHMIYSKHRQIIHAGEKLFCCSECGKRFGRKSNLNKHMRIHTGQKLFVCSECGKRFGQKSDLITHMRIHTGEKPFGCSVCGKRFGQKGHLRSHLRIHTGEKPFGCSVCDRKFGNQGHLVAHLRIHTGEKPFSCSVCGKRFGRKSHLNKHMKIHAEQKPQNI